MNPCNVHQTTYLQSGHHGQVSVSTQSVSRSLTFNFIFVPSSVETMEHSKYLSSAPRPYFIFLIMSNHVLKIMCRYPVQAMHG